MIVGLEKITENKWKEYLSSCNNASVYHTPEWMKFLIKTFDYKPSYLFSINDNGDINGMIPMMQICRKYSRSKIECIPFAHICNPLGNYTEILDDIISKYSDKERYIQINSEINYTGFIQNNSFCTHVLNLNRTKEDIWKGMDRGSTRWAVNRSIKEGVVAELSLELEDLKAFYDLNCLTKKELGVPCHPYTFFENMMNILKDMVQLYVSRFNGSIIGGGIILKYNKELLYGYGAADSRNLKQYPYNAFIWKSIEDGVDNKMFTFDFGRTSHENVGLIQFKQKWGSERRELIYSYYPKNPHSLGSNREGLTYKTVNKIIHNMPMSIYKIASNKVFKYLG